MKKQAIPNIAMNPKRNTVTPSNDIQWGLQRAIKNKLRIVEPKPNELQLDIDSVGLLLFHEMQWSILEKAGITKGWKKRIEVSKRGGSHLHVTVTMPESPYVHFSASMKNGFLDLENVFRVLFQAILGSDLKREAFNLARVLNGNKYPIVFFEKEHK